ncbi:hypothetical protein GPX89_14965 [Nocardia sp. ET3-3]|uniref:Uncharacterized protein n=1 Tax=Nocardia terrae TaxID=2675851 RepID=A0A7K1UVY1_9NOCA|nr:hypothetical protein [Nocardia terrae]MVU78543.1 hypothetical protein [Nocardia terrae]
MSDVRREVVASQVQEILNYFGKCPMCGESASARRITAQFTDGRVLSEDIAECLGYCGWKGAADSAFLAGAPPVLSHGHKNFQAPDHALPIVASGD